MKAGDFKKMIKEAVREVFQEEMREILLEAVKSPRVPIGAGGYGSVTETILTTTTPTLSESSKQAYRDMMKGMFNADSPTPFTTTQVTPSYNPPPISTVGEGTSLPMGEVNLDQIMGLMNK